MPFLDPDWLRHQPTPNLLAMLLADAPAHDLASRPLAELFDLHPSPSVCREPLPLSPAFLPILAAKELMARALAESLQQNERLDTPEKVRDLLRLRLAHLPHEVFVVLLLDAQHRLIDLKEVFRGTLTQTAVYPREVVKLALARNAAAVLLAHNHPSGAPEPTQADQQLTRTLKEALALVDVRVLDHFIVAGTARPVSFAERGLL